MPASPDLVHEIPASALAVYGHPDDPRDLRRRAPWPAGPGEAPPCGSSSAPKGRRLAGSNQDRDALAATRVAETEKAATVLAWPAHSTSTTATGKLRDDLEIRGRIVELVRRLKPRWSSAPTRRRCLRRPVLQPLRPPGDGLGDLDGRRPRAGNPTTSPSSWPPGSPPTTCRPCTCRAPWSPTAGSTSATPSRPRSTPSSATKSQLTGNGGVFRQFLRERAEEGGPRRNVRYAEGFRRLTFAV